MCGLIDDVVDFVGDALGGIDDGLHSVGSWLDDTVHGIGRGLDDLRSGDLENAWDSAMDVTSGFDDLGHNLFGSGGWLSPVVNTMTIGNPFVGPGNFISDNIVKNKEKGFLDGASSIANLASGAMGAADALTGTPSITDYNLEDYADYGDLSGVPTSTDISQYGFQLPDSAAAVADTTSNLTSGVYGMGDALSLDGSGMDLSNYGSLGVSGTGGDYYNTSATDFSNFGDLFNDFASFLNTPVGQAGSNLSGFINPYLPGLAKVVGATAENADSPWLTAGRGLASLYGNYKNQQALSDYQNAVKSQLATANKAYSPTGEYATMLRQQLERKDAAAGRRSQYGERETQLAAALAQAKADNAIKGANVLGSQSMLGATGASNASRMASLADIMQMTSKLKSSGTLDSLFDGAQDYLATVGGVI